MTSETMVEHQIQDKLNRVGLGSDQIEVKVDVDGVAKLIGWVESDGEEKTAVDSAKSIPGVTQVRDNLRVSPLYTP